MSNCAILLVLFSIDLLSANEFLSINKSSKTFQYNGKTVFLNGANQPWYNYGEDFGNNQPNGVQYRKHTIIETANTQILLDILQFELCDLYF